MAIYLDEDMMGADPNELGFPHLLVCMGLVCVTDNQLLGVHLTNVTHSQKVVPCFATWLGEQGVGGGDIRSLYGSANLEIRYGGGTGKALKRQWEAEMAQIAGVLGFHGTAYGFDASVIAPKDGFYAEYRAVHASHTCAIYYKRNEKMIFTKMDSFSGAKLPTILWARPGNTTPAYTRRLRDGSIENVPEIVVPTRVTQVTSAVVGATVKATPSNKSLLNCALRLMQVRIP
jgi:hypothetical protein